MKERRPRYDFKYFIEMPGMNTFGIGNVTIDGKYSLVFVVPTGSLAVTSLLKDPLPTFDDVVFYANCLAYDHDLPTFILPVVNRRKALQKPAIVTNRKFINEYYYNCLNMIYKSMSDIKLGPVYVNFRWPGYKDSVDLQYSAKYGKVSKEISLYAMALRQIDPLTEYLCYYRIIESVTNSNGKDWIRNNIEFIKEFNFGYVEIEVEKAVIEITQKDNPTNLFSIYKRRALKRIKELKTEFPGKDISEYFYNENRCGIVHGKEDVKIHDFGVTVKGIVKDNYILKLLSRMAIENKINSII